MRVYTGSAWQAAYLPAAGYLPLSGGTLTGDLTLSAQNDLRFADADSTNWVAFQAPSTIAANVTWTLPAADGSANQVLSTNGSGTLSWADVVTPSTTQTISGVKTFSASNVFGNASGQTFLASTTTTQDGVVVNGRPGGTGSFRVTIAPTTLSANRAQTLPDAAGTFVLDTATQTLTNKTLQSPDITVGLTIAGAAGTSGQVLTSNGSGSAPSWQAVPVGAQDYIVQSYGIV